MPQLDLLLQGSGAPAELATPIKGAAEQGFTDAVKTTAYAAAGFLIVGLLATFTIKGRRPEDEGAEVYVTSTDTPTEG